MARQRLPVRTGLAAGLALVALASAVAGCGRQAPAQPASPSQPGPAAGVVRAGPGYPCAIAYGRGYLYYSAVSGTQLTLPRSVIRRISLRTGQSSVVAGAAKSGGQPGNGSPATSAAIGPSCGLALDQNGNLLLSDSAHLGYKTGDSGQNRVRVVAAASGTFYGQSMQAAHVYTIAGARHEGDSGDGGPAAQALLRFPSGLAVDRDGNVIIAVDDPPAVRVIAARTGPLYGLTMRAGDIYTVAGGHVGRIGNGVPAVRAELGGSESLNTYLAAADTSVAADQQGNILVADSSNGEIRVVAGSSGRFYGRAMKAGYIYTVAGGGRTPERLGRPADRAYFRVVGPVAADQAGNVIFAGGGNIDVVPARSGRWYGQQMLAGARYQIAGGTRRGSGIPAGQAAVDPVGLTVDADGNIAFTDAGGGQSAIRVIAARTGRYYGQSMRAGDVYTIAGPP